MAFHHKAAVTAEKRRPRLTQGLGFLFQGLGSRGLDFRVRVQGFRAGASKRFSAAGRFECPKSRFRNPNPPLFLISNHSFLISSIVIVT